MPERLIEYERSIIISPDVEPHKFEGLVRAVGQVAGLSAYKIGFEVALGLGLSRATNAVRDNNDGVKVIYDHQKAGNDIPDTGKNFARTMSLGDVDAAILFPFTGPAVEESWIRELQQAGITVIVGAEMTHKQISESDGGYIADDAFTRMFDQAVNLGVTDFVVPGNKPDKIGLYRRLFEWELGEGNFDLYSPGLVTQGGTISEGGQAAGERWHAIMGRAIYEAEDPRQATILATQQITGAEV